MLYTKISSRLPTFTWEIENSVDPDNSNPRLIELFFFSLQSSSYRGSTLVGPPAALSAGQG